MRPTSRILTVAVAILTIAFLASCVGTPIHGEREAKKHVEEVGTTFENRAPPPDASESSSMQAYARYALGMNPSARAAWLRWRASVADVTVARSLPDPKVTFQFDYDGGLTSLMPGAMFDYVTRRRREAQGMAALAASEVAYSDLAAAQVDVAANLRDAWIDLAYADEAVRLQGEIAEAYEHAAAASVDDYVASSGGDLSAIVKLRNDAARQKANLEAMKARRDAARAAFKAAMGLARGDPDPAWPTVALSVSAMPDEEALWATFVQSNPELRKIRAVVAQAVAEEDVARASKRPDYSFGAMADLKASPLAVRPQASMTLPVWKDKIAAGIEATNERADAARADEDAALLALAATLAQDLYEVRSADATLGYLDQTALPALRTTENVSEANFQSGNGMASAPAMAKAEVAMAQLERLDALLMRERAVTEMLRLSAGILPEGVRQ